MILLGIGNILEKDDGIGVYISTYLKENFSFSPKVEIINGGVEGIYLLNRLEEHKEVLILDAIEINDLPSSIYLIPAEELRSRGLNVGGVHEIGILESLSILELQDKPVPNVTILGIVPKEIKLEIDLSEVLKESFDKYIEVALDFLRKKNISITQKRDITTLEKIIKTYQ